MLFTFAFGAQFPFPIVHSLIFPHFPSVVNFEGSSSVLVSDLKQSSLSMCNAQFTNSLYNVRGITFIFSLYLGNYLHEAYLQSRNVIVLPILKNKDPLVSDMCVDTLSPFLLQVVYLIYK